MHILYEILYKNLIWFRSHKFCTLASVTDINNQQTKLRLFVSVWNHTKFVCCCKRTHIGPLDHCSAWLLILLVVLFEPIRSIIYLTIHRSSCSHHFDRFYILCTKLADSLAKCTVWNSSTNSNSQWIVKVTVQQWACDNVPRIKLNVLLIQAEALVLIRLLYRLSMLTLYSMYFSALLSPDTYWTVAPCVSVNQPPTAQTPSVGGIPSADTFPSTLEN